MAVWILQCFGSLGSRAPGNVADPGFVDVVVEIEFVAAVGIDFVAVVDIELVAVVGIELVAVAGIELVAVVDAAVGVLARHESLEPVWFAAGFPEFLHFAVCLISAYGLRETQTGRASVDCMTQFLDYAVPDPCVRDQ